MEIHRLGAEQVYGLLERNMRKTPHWNAARRADGIFVETCHKFLELMAAQSVAIFLDNPATKAVNRADFVELVCAAAAGRGAKDMVGQRLRLINDLRSRSYRTGKYLVGKNCIWIPIRMGKAVVGVVEAALRLTKKRPVLRKHLAEALCQYFSASLQNILDAQKRLELERRDSLTGLASGQELDDYLRLQVRRCWLKRDRRELSVIFLDLDRFKRVNDRWGHLMGSRLLADVGALLRGAVQYSERMIARYGGDEFVVVLVGAKLWEAQNIAEAIRMAVERGQGLSKPITASLGVACLHAHVRKKDHRALLLASDKAMYKAKKAGRNRVVVAVGGNK